MWLKGFVLTIGLLGPAVSQTCPKYTAGYMGTDGIHESSSGRLYVNEFPSSLRAPCDGTVYRWHYCYYPVQRQNDLEVAFGAFRAVTDGDDLEHYQLRTGSYYLLHLDMRENSFTCGSVDLDQQDYFQIYENDRVGACMRNGDNEFLDILAESAPNNYRVGRWGSSSGSCQESDMTQSSSDPGTSQGLVLHLYVDINVDECALGEDNCHTLANCTDVVGGEDSFTCSCITGYTGDGVTCTNIDECLLELDACVDNADCSDTEGSYMCTCSTGYSGDGLVNCKNIDECTEGTHMCDVLATCSDTVGSYICTCNSGYTGTGFACNDINECDTGTESCGENANCANTEGSYTCSCLPGFTRDGALCVDVNECLSSNVCSSDATCLNTHGSYTCQCNTGYTGDGIICLDIDECVSESPCHLNADCSNTAGSYTCQCMVGYFGNGITCEEHIAGGEVSEDSQSSGNVVAIVLSVLGCLFLLAIIIILAVIIRTKLFPMYKKRNMRSGIDNAVYCANTDVGDKLCDINTSVYDYPSMSSTDAKSLLQSKSWSASPLEFYSTVEYREVVGISPDMTSVSFMKASVTSSHYEAPYYIPATKEEDLYSQLRHEKIKAIPRKEIEIAERLGGGEFGDVVKGYWKSVDYSVEVALKTLSGRQGQEGRTKLLQEAAIMSQFKHPNIVKLYGMVTDDYQLMMVLELLDKGDLRQLLHAMRPDPGQLVYPQTPMMLLSYSQQIALGLQYLSRKNFVHRDLAARNILISNNNTCKISDFGMARNLIEDDYYVSHGGKIPVKWTAPEALIYRKYSSASDVWSYGCLLYEIWSLGHKPFESNSNREVLVQVEAGYRLPPPPGCPQVIYGVMIRCWHPDPSSRPTASDTVLALMENEEVVLKVPEEDAAICKMAGILGAPLEAGQGMYPKLQEIYYSSLKTKAFVP